MGAAMKRLLACALVLIAPCSAAAQNPIQWNGNTKMAIARAQEEKLPLMFWVSQRADLLDDDDLRDAQSDSFRDPTVVAIAQHRYVPVRVSRNSRMLEEAQAFGLPTEFGLYIALITPDGELLDHIDPLQVASPELLAERLAEAFRHYRDHVYQQQLKPVIENREAPKQDVRAAVQTVWRLEILSADRDIVALLDRSDVTPSERARLYAMLASFATQPCIDAILSNAAKGDRDAARALGRAEAGALQWLLPEIPKEGEVSPRQIAAYRALTQIARTGSPRQDSFWTSAKPEARAKELEFVQRRAEDVLAYWTETIGHFR